MGQSNHRNQHLRRYEMISKFQTSGQCYRGLVRNCLLTILLLLPYELSAQTMTVEIDGIQTTIQYPAQVNAGENFSVTASVVNTTDRHELVMISWAPRNTMTGSHASSYRMFRPVLEGGTSSSRVMLKPGVPRQIRLYHFYYEADTLFSGELFINDPILGIAKSGIYNDRSSNYNSAPLDPMTITVLNNDKADYTVFNAPSREPLERVEADFNGDESWVIVDPNTGYEWLPLSTFQGQQLSPVLDSFESGGEFEGYRVATKDDISQLFLNHIYASGLALPPYALFGSDAYIYGYENERNQLLPIAQRLFELFGITRSVRQPEFTGDSAAGIIIGTNEVPNALLEATVSARLDEEFGGFYLGALNGSFGAIDIFISEGIWVFRESDK